MLNEPRVTSNGWTNDRKDHHPEAGPTRGEGGFQCGSWLYHHHFRVTAVIADRRWETAGRSHSTSP